MPSTRLTQRRVDTLKPRSRAYDVRDSGLKGFGIRILPSGGKRYFLHSQSGGKRIWHAIGDAGAITLDSARSRAKALLAARQDGNADNHDTRDPISFEVVADEVFQRYGRRWKPRTLAVNLGYYRNQILPWFKGKPISGITRRDILQWHASLHGVPFAADRSAPILSVILKQAEAYGYRPEGSNPCTGIKRYRRGGRERFLSADEIRRLSRVLDRHKDRHPKETSVVRLLLLTGCRKSEILTLRWSEHREGRLYLSDSKTGPRTVWLSSAARKILDDLPRTDPWIFPSSRGNGHISTPFLARFWLKARAEAGISDVRCHDLRHSYASIALTHGETVLTIGKLLGHNDPATTLKYTHLADASVREAAEAVLSALGGESKP